MWFVLSSSPSLSMVNDPSSTLPLNDLATSHEAANNQQLTLTNHHPRLPSQISDLKSQSFSVTQRLRCFLDLRYASIYINHDLNTVGHAWENCINIDDLMYIGIEIREQNRGGEGYQWCLKNSRDKTWHQRTISDTRRVSEICDDCGCHQ